MLKHGKVLFCGKLLILNFKTSWLRDFTPPKQRTNSKLTSMNTLLHFDADFSKHPVYGIHSFLVYAWHHETLCKRKLLQSNFINPQQEVYQSERNRVVVRVLYYESSRGFRGFFAGDSEASLHQSSGLCVLKVQHLWTKRTCHLGGGSAWNVRVGDCTLNRCGNKSWRRRIVVPFSSREINAPRERGARYGLRAIPTARDLHVRTANPFVYRSD